jgi:hypothetical protein
MSPTEAQVEAGARAICIAAGDDPDQMTYAREMACTGREREPKLRWQYWSGFSRACLAAVLDDVSAAKVTGE